MRQAVKSVWRPSTHQGLSYFSCEMVRTVTQTTLTFLWNWSKRCTRKLENDIWKRTRPRHHIWTRPSWVNAQPCPHFWFHLRCLQHDFTDACHRTEAVCGILYWQGFILNGETETPISPTNSMCPRRRKDTHTALTSETKCIVALLRVFSIGVASA